MVAGACGREKTAHFMVIRKEKEREKGSGDKIYHSKGTPPETFLQSSPTRFS
jgi:hypothetical protein